MISPAGLDAEGSRDDAEGSRDDALGLSIGRGGAISLTLRIANGALMLGAHVLLARALGIAAYGTYGYALAATNLLVTFSKGGLDNLLLRFVAAYRASGRWGVLRGLQRWSHRVSGGIALGLAATLAATAWAAAERLPADLPATLVLASVALPFRALSGLRQATLRSLGHVALAQIPEAVVRPLCLITLVGVASSLWERGIGAPQAMLLTSIAAFLTFATGEVFIRSRLPRAMFDHAPRYERAVWARAATVLTLVGLAHVLLNWTDVLLIGSVLGPHHVGGYAAASRLAATIALGLSAFNLVAAPLIAEYHAQGRNDRLQRVVAVSAQLVFAFSATATVAIVAGGEHLLALFGPEFTDAVPILAILAIGSVGNAMTGPASVVMSMTGAHGLLLRTMLVSLVANVILTSFLLLLVGPIGAAISTTATGVAFNVFVAVVVRRRLGVDCFVPVISGTWSRLASSVRSRSAGR